MVLREPLTSHPSLPSDLLGVLVVDKRLLKNL